MSTAVVVCSLSVIGVFLLRFGLTLDISATPADSIVPLGVSAVGRRRGEALLASPRNLRDAGFPARVPSLSRSSRRAGRGTERTEMSGRFGPSGAGHSPPRFRTNPKPG